MEEEEKREGAPKPPLCCGFHAVLSCALLLWGEGNKSLIAPLKSNAPVKNIAAECHTTFHHKVSHSHGERHL